MEYNIKSIPTPYKDIFDKYFNNFDESCNGIFTVKIAQPFLDDLDDSSTLLNPDNMPDEKNNTKHYVYSIADPSIFILEMVIENRNENDRFYKTEEEKFSNLCYAYKLKKLITAHSIFNNAFIKNGNGSGGPNDNAILNPHICSSGTNSFNKKFSPESVKEAIDLIEAKGLKVKSLMVPQALAFDAARHFPGTWDVNPYLISPTAWFIHTDAPSGLVHWIREKDTLEMTQRVMDVILRIIGRHHYGYSNPDCVFGSTGTD